MDKKIATCLAILLVSSISTLLFNIQPVKASKPLAPNGVHDMAIYESRIGETGLLFEDDNIQMWVPTRYENHSRVIFDYLVAGYENMSRLFGDNDYPYKFSIEHYPPGSEYAWGGTDARGTLFYSYTNLEDDTPEWNNWGVPHMMGYYEEMTHCFIHIFMGTGFYEALGMMIGGFEVTLRAATKRPIHTLSSLFRTTIRNSPPQPVTTFKPTVDRQVLPITYGQPVYWHMYSRPK